MGEGRNMETLDAFFAEMTDPQKQAIEAVAMDMWEPFINRVQHHCPQAKIVFDLFHLVKAHGEVIDEVRREEVRQAVTKEDRRFLKGSRYLLPRNACNLTPSQRVCLKQLLDINERISAVYQLPPPRASASGWTARDRLVVGLPSSVPARSPAGSLGRDRRPPPTLQPIRQG